MYAYFGSNGRLLETYFDSEKSIAGSTEFSKIWAYWDNDAWRSNSIVTATCSFYTTQGNKIVNDIAMEFSTGVIPTSDIDHVYWEEDTNYRLACISVPKEVLAHVGTVIAVIRAFNATGAKVMALGDLPFEVNGSYAYDGKITQSQYDYILAKLNIESAESIPNGFVLESDGSYYLAKDGVAIEGQTVGIPTFDATGLQSQIDENREAIAKFQLNDLVVDLI